MEWEESFKTILPKAMEAAYAAAEPVNKKMLSQGRVSEDKRIYPFDITSAASEAAEKIMNPWIDKNIPIIDRKNIFIKRKIGNGLSEVEYNGETYIMEILDNFSMISGLRKVAILNAIGAPFPKIKKCMASALRKDPDMRESFDGYRELFIFYEFVFGLDYPDPMEDFNDRQMATLMYIFYTLLKNDIYVNSIFIFSNPEDYVWLVLDDVFLMEDSPFNYRESLRYLDQKYDNLSARPPMINAEYAMKEYLEQMSRYYYIEGTQVWAEKLFACFSKELDLLNQ